MLICPMLRCFEDGGAMPMVVYSKNRSSNKHYLQNEDVLCNPQNPLNPDSELSVKGIFDL
jgi:hypothetical protein